MTVQTTDSADDNSTDGAGDDAGYPQREARSAAAETFSNNP